MARLGDTTRYILRERPSRDRTDETDYVLLELEIRGGMICICATSGYSKTLAEGKAELFRNRCSELVLRAERMYFVDATGQLIEQILEFFPEMKPYMKRHLQTHEHGDLIWMSMPFPGSRDIPYEKLWPRTCAGDEEAA